MRLRNPEELPLQSATTTTVNFLLCLQFKEKLYKKLPQPKGHRYMDCLVQKQTTQHSLCLHPAGKHFHFHSYLTQCWPSNTVVTSCSVQLPLPVPPTDDHFCSSSMCGCDVCHWLVHQEKAAQERRLAEGQVDRQWEKIGTSGDKNWQQWCRLSSAWQVNTLLWHQLWLCLSWLGFCMHVLRIIPS